MEEFTWKKMYMILFRGIVEASEMLPISLDNAPSQLRLNTAVLHAEELYLSSESEKQEE